MSELIRPVRVATQLLVTGTSCCTTGVTSTSRGASTVLCFFFSQPVPPRIIRDISTEASRVISRRRKTANSGFRRLHSAARCWSDKWLTAWSLYWHIGNPAHLPVHERRGVGVCEHSGTF